MKITRTKGIVGLIIALILSATAVVFTPQREKDKKQENQVYKPLADANNCLFVIVPGHGGKDNGKYYTGGKRSPIWPDGHQVLEGVSTKLYAYELTASLMKEGLDVIMLNTQNRDMTLQERVNQVNALYSIDKRVVAIFIHHNAQQTYTAPYYDCFGNRGYLSIDQGGATGAESYTSIGLTEADNFNNNFIIPQFEKDMPDIKWRYGYKQKGKEANFTVLAYTKCPSVLEEWLFMTTYTDSQMIASDSLRQIWVSTMTKSCANYDKSLSNS